MNKQNLFNICNNFNLKLVKIQLHSRKCNQIIEKYEWDLRYGDIDKLNFKKNVRKNNGSVGLYNGVNTMAFTSREVMLASINVACGVNINLEEQESIGKNATHICQNVQTLGMKPI